jgi:hypothetical protein
MLRFCRQRSLADNSTTHLPEQEQGMKTLTAALVVGMALGLTGCTAPETRTSGEPIATATSAAQDDQQMTGSRIPKRTTTDRMLKTVGAADIRNALDSAPRPLNAN